MSIRTWAAPAWAALATRFVTICSNAGRVDVGDHLVAGHLEHDPVERGEPPPGVAHGGGQVGRRPVQRQAVGARPGQDEQVVGEPGEPVGLAEGGAQRPLGGGRIGIGQAQLQLTPQDGDGGTQLVRGVVDEGALALGRLLDPVEHAVERAGQRGHLVVAGRLRQPLLRRRGAELTGPGGDRADRPQRRPHDAPHQQRQPGHQHRAEDEEDDQHAALGGPDGGEAGADRQVPVAADRAYGEQGVGGQARRGSAYHQGRAVRRTDVRGRDQRGRRRRRRAHQDRLCGDQLGVRVALHQHRVARLHRGGEVAQPGGQLLLDRGPQQAREHQVAGDEAEPDHHGDPGRVGGHEPSAQRGRQTPHQDHASRRAFTRRSGTGSPGPRPPRCCAGRTARRSSRAGTRRTGRPRSCRRPAPCPRPRPAVRGGSAPGPAGS